MRHTPRPTQVIKAKLLLQAANGREAVPGRLRRGDTLHNVVRDYQCCTEPQRTIGMTCGNVQIERGLLAVEFAGLRDLLQHNDDALSAVVDVRVHAGAQTIMLVALYHSTLELLKIVLIRDLWRIAAYLVTQGATLHLDWPRVALPTAPVIRRLVTIAQEIEMGTDPDGLLGAGTRSAGEIGREEMAWATSRFLSQ